MKFCRDCAHFNAATDNCQQPDNSPILDIVSGTRGHIQAEICRHIPVLCGTFAMKFEARVTTGTVEDWEAA